MEAAKTVRVMRTVTNTAEQFGKLAATTTSSTARVRLARSGTTRTKLQTETVCLVPMATNAMTARSMLVPPVSTLQPRTWVA